MKNTLANIAAFIMTIIAVQVITILVMLLWPYDVLQVKHIGMVTPQVKAGDTAIYSLSYCKLIEAQGVVYNEIIDEKGTIWDTIKKTAYRGPQCDNIAVSLFIPPDIKTGKYQIKVTIHYQVNFIKEVSETYNTPFFEVEGLDLKS